MKTLEQSFEEFNDALNIFLKQVLKGLGVVKVLNWLTKKLNHSKPSK